MSDGGSLVLVATPIGNLGDTSTRSIDTLRSADVIACEDTRHTRKLLNHFDIRNVPVIAVHEHNEIEKSAAIVERIRVGETVALVSDAGTPGISDPGERVVAAVLEAGFRVSIVPGPSAAPSAIAISGLPAERWCFEGFLPRKGAERARRLRELAGERRTSVLYESPHRVAATVRELASACGPDRRVAMVRELTKIHEEVWHGTLSGLLQRLDASPAQGEIVLVLGGDDRTDEPVSDERIRDALQQHRASGVSQRDAVASVAEQLDVPKNRVYSVATASTD